MPDTSETAGLQAQIEALIRKVRAIRDSRRHTGSARTTSSLRADVIFGKDRRTARTTDNASRRGLTDSEPGDVKGWNKGECEQCCHTYPTDHRIGHRTPKHVHSNR